MVGFEGGQIPLIRRIPKRGFSHKQFKTEYLVVNIGDFDELNAKGSISPDILRAAGLAKGRARIKVLGNGEIKNAVTVQAHAFSASAKKKIETAGGRIEILAK